MEHISNETKIAATEQNNGGEDREDGRGYADLSWRRVEGLGTRSIELESRTPLV